jgi:hypothetical protein
LRGIILGKALGVLAVVVDKHHLTDAEHPPLLCHGDDHLECTGAAFSQSPASSIPTEFTLALSRSSSRPPWSSLTWYWVVLASAPSGVSSPSPDRLLMGSTSLTTLDGLHIHFPAHNLLHDVRGGYLCRLLGVGLHPPPPEPSHGDGQGGLDTLVVLQGDAQLPFQALRYCSVKPLQSALVGAGVNSSHCVGELLKSWT